MKRFQGEGCQMVVLLSLSLSFSFSLSPPLSFALSLCECACVCVCARARARVCVRVLVRMSMCWCVDVWMSGGGDMWVDEGGREGRGKGFEVSPLKGRCGRGDREDRQLERED